MIIPVGGNNLGIVPDTNMAQKRIVDNRKKEKYMVDDEYLNGMARLCGWKGTIVYNSLCRHASKAQECFPSIKKMAEQHGVNRKTIIKGIETLEERRVIEVGKKRTKAGQWLNNTYTLLDKTEWNYSQVPHKDPESMSSTGTRPCPSQGPDQVPHKDTKETHSEGNTYKETHNLAKQSFAGKEVNDLISEFEKVNPTINYGNKTQRKSIEEMLSKFGYEKLLNTIKFAISIQGKEFAPTITTPRQLQENMGKLINYYKRENQPKKGMIKSL